MKKFLYITHLSGKRVNRFWYSSIRAAQELGYEFHLACNMKEAEHPIWNEDCLQYHIVTHQIDFNRNPLSPEASYLENMNRAATIKFNDGVVLSLSNQASGELIRDSGVRYS